MVSVKFHAVVILFLLSSITASGSSPSPDAVELPAHAVNITGAVAQDVRPLEPGSVTRRELEGGLAHYYVLHLSSAQYVRVVLNQRGIDVVITLIGADGQEILEADSANGTRGQETVSWIADVAGDYRLKVRPKETAPPPSQYEISIVQQRAAAPDDSKRVAAERSFVSGEMLRKTGATREQAIVKYDEARQLWREVNDARGEAAALLGKGKTYFYLNRMSESAASYTEALRIFELLPDRLDEAVALQVTGITQLARASPQAALDNFQRALQLFIAEGDKKFEGGTLYQIGRVYYLEGNITEALVYYNKALPIRHALDPQGEAYTLISMGRVYANSLGENAEALALYNQAVPLLRKVQENRLAAQTLGDLGRLHYTEGRYESALNHYNEALRLLADGDKLVRAELLTYVGMVYSAQGRHQEAIDNFYSKALELQRSGSDRIGEGHTLKNMGIAYSSLGNYEKALGRLKDASVIWHDVMYRTAEADTQYEIARVKSRIGTTKSLLEAGDEINLALPTLEALRTKISSQTLRTSFFASVQKYYELYINVLMRLYEQTRDKKYEALALGYSERARARSLLDTLIEANAKIREGVAPELLQQEAALQQSLSRAAQRQMFGNQHTTGQAAEAQSIASLLQQYRELEAQIREKSPHYASLVYPQPATLADIQTRILDKDQMLLEYSLGEERSYLWAVTPTSIESYVLPKRAEIEAAAGHVRELLTARNQTIKGETDFHALMRVKRADEEYGRVAVALSQMLLGKVEMLPRVTRLIVVSDGKLQFLPFAALPVPGKVDDTLAGNRAGTVRHDKPFPLLLSHEVETQPSVSLLAELRRREALTSRPAPLKLIAVIADPVFNVGDERFDEIDAALAKRGANEPLRVANPAHPSPEETADAKTRETLNRAGLVNSRGDIARLAFTRREADAILALVPLGDGMKAIDFDARKDLVIGGELKQYRIIHFATHGLLNEEHPELSGILLSLLDERRRPREGFLQMHEVYNLRLSAEMVVLSACETGIGRMVKGEGLAALSRGFMYAGAKRVVASLWEVNDFSTAALMTNFYRHLLAGGEQRPAAALRAAQIEIWRKEPEQSPYFWAAFIVQGDSR
jgi:tetratricopeptide (TPR) repeat protein